MANQTPILCEVNGVGISLVRLPSLSGLGSIPYEIVVPQVYVLIKELNTCTREGIGLLSP